MHIRAYEMKIELKLLCLIDPMTPMSVYENTIKRSLSNNNVIQIS